MDLILSMVSKLLTALLLEETFDGRVMHIVRLACGWKRKNIHCELLDIKNFHFNYFKV